MAEPRIDEIGLPVYAPGDYDFVRVVDRSTGASRNALAPEVTAAARAISEALDGLVADAREDIEAIIRDLGYLAPVPYASGLDVNDIKFTVSYNGDVYAPKPELVPFTTGAWNPAQWNVIQGDINLRSDLSDPAGGGALVAFRLDAPGAVARDMQEKASETVTPRDFGAVGDHVADDTAAVQSFLDYVSANDVPNASFSGRFRITDTIRIGGLGSDTSMATKTLHCNVHLLVHMSVSDQKPAVLVERVIYTSFPGSIRIDGAASNWSPTSRTLFDGIHFGVQCTGASFGTISVNNCHRWGIVRGLGAQTGGRGRIEAMHGSRCGAGPTPSAEDTASNYTITAVSSSGSGSSERSVVTLDKPLPVGVEVGSHLIGDPEGRGNVYAVMATAGTNQVEVYPRIDADFAANPNVKLAFGGVVYQEGSSAGLWSYSVVNAINCSQLWIDRCIYGNHVGNMHGSIVMCGALGSPPTTPVYGGSIGGLYIEGTARVSGFVTFNRNTPHFIAEMAISNPNGTYGVTSNGGGAYVKNGYGGVVAIDALDGPSLLGKPMAAPRSPGQDNATASAASLSALPNCYAIGAQFRGSGGTKTIRLVTPSEYDLRNGHYTLAMFSSAKDNATPHGNWLFSSEDAASTVHGGASKTFTDIGSRLFFCVYNSAANDWRIHAFSASNAEAVSSTYNWPSLASGATQTTTITVPGAALGDYASASMSVPLNGTRLWAEVTAADTVTVYQRNDTGAPVDLPSGTLKVLVNKA